MHAAPPRTKCEWNAVLSKHMPTVIRRLCARGISSEDAHEFAQAAWLRIFERCRDARQARLELPGMVVVVARNLWLDEQRRRARRPRTSLDDIEPAERIQTSSRLEGRQLLRTVERRLSDLDPRDSTIFEDVVLAERPIREVAAEHGIGRSQAYSIVAWVRKVLQDALVVT
ncbi:MAG: sigma-70 family RNA polymerase sigma factor [Myxococcota bacterium]